MSRGHSTTENLVSYQDFKAEVTQWAERIGVEPKEIYLRPMRRKWGSCSTRGRVTFNTDLLSEPEQLRRRVIVEELLHLKVPNHGMLFRSLLRAYLGLPPESLSSSRSILKLSKRTHQFRGPVPDSFTCHLPRVSGSIRRLSVLPN
jgi:predicted metal-dependent hydrolase